MEVLARGGRRCSGSSSTLVLVRGAGWRLLWSSSVSLFLLACRGGEGKKVNSMSQASGSIERGFSAVFGAVSVPVCLPSRGGMEVDLAGLMAQTLVLCLRETMENSPPMAISKRRSVLASAICGQRAGLAMLVAQESASSFLLQVRIFRSCGLAPKPPTQPSGFVPGCGWGGATLQLLNAGVRQRLDCVSAIFVRVCFVLVKDLVVFSFFLWILFVSFYPPLK
jgi:hypothetical protein